MTTVAVSLTEFTMFKEQDAPGMRAIATCRPIYHTLVKLAALTTRVLKYLLKIEHFIYPLN